MKLLSLRLSWERLSLRTQLFLSTLLIICGLTGSLLLIVRHSMRSAIVRQLDQSTHSSVRAFENVQVEHEIQLSRSAELLAALPTLKALMSTQDAVTVDDASTPFWKLAGSDVFVLANPEGTILGFHMTKAGWTRAVAQFNLGRSLERRERTAWWYANGQLYWVFLSPIESGGGNEKRELGELAVGYQIDSSLAESLAVVAGSQITLSVNGEIVASTLPSSDAAELQRILHRHHVLEGAGTHEVRLITGSYQIAPILIHDNPLNPVTCYVAVPLQYAESFMRDLNRTIFVAGLSAILVSAILLSFTSRTITRPLGDLVGGVLALAKGNYAYSITPRGSSEVAAVGEAFANMRSELQASEQRKLATERIAALGHAANSISHDLRHYLAAVVANAEFLYDADSLKLNRDEVYEEIKAASHQMVNLLDSLRELSRGERAISPVRAFLDQVVRKASDTVQASPDLRRTVSIRTVGEMDGVFDPQKMERAFFNLILNACEATAQTGGKVEIEIYSSEKAFEIRVSDNGPGIPTAVRGTLFDPFVSADKPNGTGLGLAIVQKMIHDHNGSIHLEKTSEEGTVFLIKLPRAPLSSPEYRTASIPA